jgi:hypothetical protein
MGLPRARSMRIEKTFPTIPATAQSDERIVHNSRITPTDIQAQFKSRRSYEPVRPSLSGWARSMRIDNTFPTIPFSATSEKSFLSYS